MKRSWPLALTLVLVTGCTGLPSSGGVQEGLERAPEPEGIVFLAPDPQPGGSPEQIVEGFLDAATAGVADRFETAQKYLTDDARQEWEPGADVTIYSGSASPVVALERTGEVTVTVPVAAHVDANGIYTEAQVGSSKSFSFGLTRVDGQWRISDLDDGVLISGVNFGTQYRQVPLAFLSPDGRYVIPDPRWFPEQNPASFAVQALLNGPSEWMLPGVITAIPTGTDAEPVSVSDGTAEVRLSEAALAASPADRGLIAAQFEHTLMQLPQVRRVKIFVGDVPYAEDASEPRLTVDPPGGHVPAVLQEDGVYLATGSAMTPLEGYGIDEDANYTALAVPYGDLIDASLPIAVRLGAKKIGTLARGEAEAATLMEGSDLLAPSFDSYGWLWSGEVTNEGALMVTRPGSEVVTVVSAPGLADHEVRAVRVSRDGARLAIIQTLGKESAIQIGMIVRDDDGTPLAVSAPQTVGYTVQDAMDLAWVDHVTIAVLGSSDEAGRAVHTVPVAGPSVALLSVPGARTITSGRGERELWVATAEGQLYNRAGNGWRRVGEDAEVREIALPG